MNMFQLLSPHSFYYHSFFHRKSHFYKVEVGKDIKLQNDLEYSMKEELESERPDEEKVFKAIEKGKEDREFRIKFFKFKNQNRVRIREEIKITKEMSPLSNSVNVFHSEENQGTAVLVTEFLSTLAENYKSNSEAILSAVKAMHEKNILHQDLSPETVRFGDDQELKIADYSWATYTTKKKWFRSLFRRKSKSNLAGKKSITYWAPERLQNNAYDQKSDIWSIGVILDQINHHGQHPYSLTSDENAITILKNIENMVVSNNPMLRQDPVERDFPQDSNIDDTQQDKDESDPSPVEIKSEHDESKKEEINEEEFVNESKSEHDESEKEEVHEEETIDESSANLKEWVKQYPFYT